jgi:hypothetical protein
MHTVPSIQSVVSLAAIMFLVAAPSTLALDRPESREPDEALPEVRRQVLGTGAWESGQDTAGKRSWHAELKRRDDDSVIGRITVIGSAVVQEARVEAQVSGTEIYGVLVGDDERQVGTFSGLVMKDGLGGTYTFENGDTGTWSWNSDLSRGD